MGIYRKIDRKKVQFDFLNVYDEEIACQSEIESMGGKILYVKFRRREGIHNYYKGIKDFFEKHKDYMVIHCHYQGLQNIDMISYAAKAGIPVRIAHAHSSGYEEEPGFPLRALIYYNRWKINRVATEFFACSELAGSWMFGKTVDEGIEVINNSIDAEKFRYDDAERINVRKQLNLEGRFVVGTVGRFANQKNTVFLVEVFSEILKAREDAFLLLVGDGMLRDEVERKIEQLGLGSSTKLLGAREDTNRILQGMDVFVLPSKAEGFGTVLVEAQTSGLKCFASENVIPESAKVTDLLSFIPLESGAKVWAKTISEESDYKRSDRYETIVESGYDINDNVKMIENTYLKLVGRK
ncbi:putative glycosyltransferase EpsF [Andreesenia angusta]|uniref:Putative glycosyltransferase EpsF n=2 Tax=Andreesenia angusta TaxID=39480 RepID=A0A1S1V6V9_9FIRM|nr:putative glycosyltransferase EpsF [Andreesenia angusta]